MSNYQEDQDLVISCLQQSIRKGYTDLALKYFEQIYTVDKSKALYKLSVILIEDIGLANTLLLKNFFETQLKTNYIETRGGTFYLHQLIRSMCDSPKDRSCCELFEFSQFYIQDHKKHIAEQSQDFSKETFNTSQENLLLDILYNKKLPLVKRFLAGWDYFSSKKLHNPFSIKEEDLKETFQNIRTNIIKNADVSNIIQYSYFMHKEPYLMALILLDSIYHFEYNRTVSKWKTGDIIVNESKPQMVTDKWLFDGFSHNSKLSNKAFDLFLEQKSPIKDFLNSFPNINKKTILFYLFYRHTGQHTNKRLVYPTAVGLVQFNQKAQFAKLMENNTLELTKAIKLFDESLPKLYDSIETVIKTPNPKYFPF